MGLFDIFGGYRFGHQRQLSPALCKAILSEKSLGRMVTKGDNVKLNILAAVASTPVMLAVYYVGQGIMYNNWVAPLASIPGDLIQSVVGLLIAIPLCIALKKTPYFQKEILMKSSEENSILHCFSVRKIYNHLILNS